MSYYRPRPKQRQKCLPKCIPRTVVPSGLGDQGIVGNWLFYYLKGGDHLHDFSPENNHGTLKNDPVWKDGSYEWALLFDGEDDYADGSLSNWDTTLPITLSAWIKTSASGVHKDIIGVGSVANDNEQIGLNARDDGYFKIYFYGSDVAEGWSANLNDGNWHYVVGVIKADGTQIGYIDGSQVGSYDPGTVSYAGDDTFRIGWVRPDRSHYFDGLINLPRIYLTTKSSSWIKRRFEQTRGLFGV